jgi:predicted phage baseplate assembly protein
MALPDRPLDDRSFQDLVDEAKKKIPLYCPEWTDHNVSDPGITLIELFAWMMDMLLYRLNQVPSKHQVALLELLGISLSPPQAATVPLTFYLSAPQSQTVVIPRGTGVSTSRAETGPAGGEAIVFTTDRDLVIRPAQLTHLVVRRRAASGGWQYEEIALQRLRSEFAPFSRENPHPGEAIYFGFDVPLDDHLLGLELTCLRAGGLNIIPESPPLLWQAWTSSGWQAVEVEEDQTGGMSWSGQVRLHLPQMARRIGEGAVAGIESHWVRCQVVAPVEGQQPYASSPLMRDVAAVTWGATIRATHATETREEPLGRSDGSPGQIFYLEHTPVLPRREEERVEIWQAGMENWESWSEVEDFSRSGPEDRHYTCDSVSGEIRFGPALRQRDGAVIRYGAIPPRGADIRMARYRYGGGVHGNVRAGTVTELRTAPAYVDHVSNRVGAQGGLDQETLENATFRARNMLRTRYRAVTPGDYEFLTLSAFPGEVGRVRCLQAQETGAPGPGHIYVIVVPALPEEEAQHYIPLSRLALGEPLRQRITAFLDERRLLTTQLQIRDAGYRRVRVVAQVVARPGADEARLERDLLAALERFVNPLRGGPEGTGWPFGRELYLSDLYACIQAVDGLLTVRELEMFWVDENDAAHRADRRIELMAHEVLVSDIHEIQIVAP